ncbi:hypothetical protein MES4922_210016 [Mesorhizobium ventifaucium]|uniref:Uncharacterized protein n=1 Tax=Mesorhizobium ventifaucium TaxID=666020 RepID=A0ABM9DQN7_9HYPH|nr:hypothetical protein MES4922_210016 [Mesorhizobium ventifaucium]
MFSVRASDPKNGNRAWENPMLKRIWPTCDAPNTKVETLRKLIAKLFVLVVRHSDFDRSGADRQLPSAGRSQWQLANFRD